MNANDVIESYVTDVAVRLPRKQRNDVAFELRALLDEELQGKSEEVGRAPDSAMAIEFLRAFGRPEDVAARYRPALTIVDPSDGRGFLRATIIGLAVIWVAGLLKVLLQPVEPGIAFLSVLGQWWVGTVVASLWWPGALVVGFGMAAWSRRRRPQSSEWKPRPGDRISGGRTGMVMALIGIVCGLLVLVDPRRLLDVVWEGRAAPAAYTALTYTDTFLHRQGPLLLVLLLLHIPVSIALIASGRWSTTLRRIQDGLGLAICAALVWTIVDGPVFAAPSSDGTLKFFLILIVAYTLIDFGIKRYRSVRPAPTTRVERR